MTPQRGRRAGLAQRAGPESEHRSPVSCDPRGWQGQLVAEGGGGSASRWGWGALRGLDATRRNRATVKPVFLGTLGLAPEKKQQWLCGGAKARKDRKRKGFFRRRVVR